MGKPKHGPVCELMRRTRLHFKYLLKQCQQREDVARADAMAKSMQAKHAVSFWKNVSKTYKNVYPKLQMSMVLMNLRPYPSCGKHILNPY